MLKCKDSDLWQYAEDEFKKLTLNEKLERYAKVLELPCETIDDKITIIMKLPNRIDLLCEHLNEKESDVCSFLSCGYSYNEVCKELDYASRSSVRIILKNIRTKLLEQLDG